MPGNLGVTIRIEGVDQLVKRLGSVVAQETLQGPLQRAVDRIRQVMTTYPPTRPGQIYQRTGNLGRSWTTSVGGMEASVTSKAHGRGGVAYGPFVQSDAKQAWMHRGRWTTDLQAVEHETPAIQADFKDTIDKALGQ